MMPLTTAGGRGLQSHGFMGGGGTQGKAGENSKIRTTLNMMSGESSSNLGCRFCHYISATAALKYTMEQCIHSKEHAFGLDGLKSWSTLKIIVSDGGKEKKIRMVK